MIVCHISSMHPANDGRIFHKACVGLVSRGIKTYLIVTHSGNDEILGVKVIGLKERLGLKRRIFSSFEAFRKAFKMKADIYHFHDPDLIPWMLILSALGRKVVFDLHENYESRLVKLPGKKFISGITFNTYKVFETFICNRFSGLVVVTKSMKNGLRKIKRPVVVIDNLVFLERMKNIKLSSKRSEKITIYTSGNNTPARNCMQGVEALGIVARKYPDVKMIFAGRFYPQNYKNDMRMKAKELGVLENLELEGMVDWEENFYRTSKYHIGCVFYEDNPNNRVTLPNRLYEYMFCGLAVLGENFPEVRKVIEGYNCGLVVDSSNPQMIAEKILYLMENQTIISQMGINGQNAILSECNYEKALDRLMNFYQAIVN